MQYFQLSCCALRKIVYCIPQTASTEASHKKRKAVSKSAGASDSQKETTMDFAILEQLGKFFGGLGNIFKGLFDVIKTAMGWAGQ